MRYLLPCVSVLSGCLLVSGVVSKDCNDGFVDEGEECDLGEGNSDTAIDGCRTDCTLFRCGDGVTDSNEACDDQNQATGDGCDQACAAEVSALSVGDINNSNVNNARFAVYTTSLDTQDTNGDGAGDVDVAVITLFVTDREDFCAQLAADPNALVNLPDLEAVRVLVIQEDAPGQGGFVVGETLQSNVGILSVVFAPVPNQTFVGVDVFLRVGGADQIEASNPTFFVNDGRFTLQSLAKDGKLQAQANITLLADRSGVAPFDTDDNPLDQKVTQDFTAINSTFSLSVENISPCP